MYFTCRTIKILAAGNTLMNLAIANQFAEVLSAKLLLYLDYLCINVQSANVFTAKHVLGTNLPKFLLYGIMIV